MKLLSVEKGSPVPILFVYIISNLTMVISSKANVENSAKARYVDETDYRF